jgi:nitrite reductase/ring-hydroxylating ferredoxin subunit
MTSPTSPSPTNWTDVDGEAPTSGDTVASGRIDDTGLAIATRDGTPAVAATCSHLGGPLDDGDIVDGCVRRPWHGSTVRLADGSVARRPLTAPQPAYDVRRDEAGRLQARRQPLP